MIYPDERSDDGIYYVENESDLPEFASIDDFLFDFNDLNHYIITTRNTFKNLLISKDLFALTNSTGNQLFTKIEVVPSITFTGQESFYIEQKSFLSNAYILNIVDGENILSYPNKHIGDTIKTLGIDSLPITVETKESRTVEMSADIFLLLASMYYDQSTNFYWTSYPLVPNETILHHRIENTEIIQTALMKSIINQYDDNSIYLYSILVLSSIFFISVFILAIGGSISTRYTLNAIKWNSYITSKNRRFFLQIKLLIYLLLVGVGIIMSFIFYFAFRYTVNFIIYNGLQFADPKLYLYDFVAFDKYNNIANIIDFSNPKTYQIILLFLVPLIFVITLFIVPTIREKRCIRKRH